MTAVDEITIADMVEAMDTMIETAHTAHQALCRGDGSLALKMLGALAGTDTRFAPAVFQAHLTKRRAEGLIGK